jgi:hypothetical protein
MHSTTENADDPELRFQSSSSKPELSIHTGRQFASGKTIIAE